MATRRFVPQRSRRPTIWLVAQGNAITATSSSSVSTLISAVSAETFPVPTLVRVRGEIVVEATTFAATPGKIMAYVGIAVVSQAALAGPSVSLPFTDGSRDWMWWRAFPLTLRSGNVTGPTGPQPFLMTSRMIVDSKSMRKIPGDSVLVLVTENVPLISTGTFEASWGLRMLLKR